MLFVPPNETALAANIAAQPRGLAVRPSEMADVYALAANLRAADRAEVESLGIDVRVGIRRSYRNAVLRKTYLIDGEVAAMSGLCGPLLGDIGEPYLMTAPAVETMPVTFLKQARTSLAGMLQLKRRLEVQVDANYTKACRLLEVLGFTLGPPRPLGPHDALFRKCTMMRAD